MNKVKKIISEIVIAAILVSSFSSTAVAATLGSNVTATIPTFKVTMNGQEVDNTYREYPFLVYNDITYFPMTYWDMRFLGVVNTWSQETGSVINVNGTAGEYKPSMVTKANAKKNTAQISTGKYTVCGNNVDNANEQYPILSYKDVPYFPLTWNWCQQFGWNINFDNASGLTINTTGKAPAPATNAGSTATNTQTTNSTASVDVQQARSLVSKIATENANGLTPIAEVCLLMTYTPNKVVKKSVELQLLASKASFEIAKQYVLNLQSLCQNDPYLKSKTATLLTYQNQLLNVNDPSLATMQSATDNGTKLLNVLTDISNYLDGNKATANTQVSSTQTASPSTPVETASQKKAVTRAGDYLRSSSFSYESLVKQLEYEGFTHADAVYAVDRCGADWKENAARQGKRYLQNRSFTFDELVFQLEFEDYTHEEAVYGATKALGL